MGKKISHLSQETKKSRFLEALSSSTGTIKTSAEIAKVGFRTVYDWRGNDPEFRAAWESIEESRTVALEESLYDRAITSDTVAAIFLLKARRPHMYRDVIRQENVNLNVHANLDRLDRDLSDAQVEELLSVVEGKRRAIVGNDGSTD